MLWHDGDCVASQLQHWGRAGLILSSVRTAGLVGINLTRARFKVWSQMILPLNPSTRSLFGTCCNH